jgi:DNA adenine methylase
MLSTLIQYFGGKQKLARKIISIMPKHKHYVEVFFGSGAIFFNKPKARLNTINDIDGNLVNLFVQVRDNFDALAQKVYWTLNSRDEFNKFRKHSNNKFKDINDVDRALMYLFLNKTMFCGRPNSPFSAKIEGGAGFNLALIKRMKSVREKLDGVIIENRSYKEIIPKYSRSEDVLMYLDPPYWVSNNNDYYQYDFTETDHKLLFELLNKVKCKWILSYDDVPEIRYLHKDFHILKVPVKYTKFISVNQIIQKKNELLITNYKPNLSQLHIFEEN